MSRENSPARGPVRRDPRQSSKSLISCLLLRFNVLTLKYLTVQRDHSAAVAEGRKEYGMAKSERRERSLALYETILKLKDVEECCRFFEDLCTVAELRAMAQRLEVAVLLDSGMIYNDILERTGASSATISRVNRALQYGADGYKTVLPRLK